MAPGVMAQDESGGDESHEFTFTVLYRHVTDPAPVHDFGDQFDQVFFLDGEQVCVHKFLHFKFGGVPVGVVGDGWFFPGMHRLVLLLVSNGGSGDTGNRFIGGDIFPEMGEGPKCPAGACFVLFGPFANDIQVFRDIGLSYFLFFESCFCQGQEFFYDQFFCGNFLIVYPVEGGIHPEFSGFEEIIAHICEA